MKSVKDLLGSFETDENFNYHDSDLQQAEYYNNQVGDLDEFDCPICKNKGYIRKVVYMDMYKEYRPVMEICKCMKKRTTLQKAKRSGLGEYLNKHFDDFEITEAWQRDLKQKAYDYIKKDGNDWFVTLGQSGSGKTLISCIITNYLLLNKNKDVIYITWTDFVSKLKRNIMGNNSNDVSDYLEIIKNVEVLFIDELLKKYNDTDLKYIIEIINYRYTKDLKTIITSERTLNELLKIDEATFSRAVEKSKEFITNIPKDSKKNYRLKGVI